MNRACVYEGISSSWDPFALACVFEHCWDILLLIISLLAKVAIVKL